MARSRWGLASALAAITLIESTSCSLLVSRSEDVFVSATDPAALIYVDGRLVGRGKASLQLRRNEDHAIMARIDDRAGTAQIGTRISDAGIADIVGCALILVPCLGLGAVGFRSLTPSNLLIVVPPPGAASATSPGQAPWLEAPQSDAGQKPVPGMLGGESAPSTPRRSYWERPR